MVAIANNFIDPNKNTKMRGDDRAFRISLIDETAPLSSTGLVDKRLFTGVNRIRAVRDEPSYNLWYFKYDKGELPEDLKGIRFTKFDLAKEHLEKYFLKRNIKIEEVID